MPAILKEIVIISLQVAKFKQVKKRCGRLVNLTKASVYQVCILQMQCQGRLLMRLDGLLSDLDLGIHDLENEVQPDGVRRTEIIIIMMIIMSKRCFIGFGSRKCGWGH